MRIVGRLVLLVFLSIWANVPALAQDPCKFESEDPLRELAKALSQAKSCDAAAAKLHECAWGSSADTQLAPIVVRKCEKMFFDRMPPAAQKRYADEMQLCAYEYARQEGTMYMSAAAMCQVDVAARFAANPAAASQSAARASFDCDKAHTPLELAICSDIKLGHADIVLSNVYSRAAQQSDKKDRFALAKSEKQWLQRIPQKCGLTAMPFSHKSLDCVRNEFELRFTSLDSCQEGITECLQDVGDQDAVASVPSPRASFDCDAPSTALEIVICADAELGQTDIKLAQAYGDAKAAMNGEQNKALIDSERQWLRFVTRACPLGVIGAIPSVFARACVREAFATRLVQLHECPRKELQRRIPCLNNFRLSER